MSVELIARPRPDAADELAIWNPAQIASVKGGELTKAGKLRVQMPEGPDGTYVPQKVSISFQKH